MEENRESGPGRLRDPDTGETKTPAGRGVGCDPVAVPNCGSKAGSPSKGGSAERLVEHSLQASRKKDKGASEPGAFRDSRGAQAPCKERSGAPAFPWPDRHASSNAEKIGKGQADSATGEAAREGRADSQARSIRYASGHTRAICDASAQARAIRHTSAYARGIPDAPAHAGGSHPDTGPGSNSRAEAETQEQRDDFASALCSD